MDQTRLAAAAALLIATTLPLAAGAQQDFRWTGRLASGQTLEIRNLNGDIRVEPGTGNEVEVVGRRSGEDVEEVQIRVVPGSSRVIVCAVFPHTGRWREEGTDACSADRRTVVTDRFDARVDFIVRVPAGAGLVARTVSGDVQVRGLHAAVSARSVSGDVEVSTSGPAEARSVSGNVVATLGGTLGRTLRFASVSGNVILRVPAEIDADLTARTLSGRIDSELPISVRPRDRSPDRRVRVHIGEEARGTLGRGGAEISAESVSGNIRLVRAR